MVAVAQTELFCRVFNWNTTFFYFDIVWGTDRIFA